MDCRRLGGWGGVVSTPAASGGTPLAQPARTPAVHKPDYARPNFAARFSKNAAIPSAASLERKQRS